MRFCTNCGTQLEDGVHFCPNCGAKLTEELTENAAQEPETTVNEPAEEPTAEPVSAEPVAEPKQENTEPEPAGAQTTQSAQTAPTVQPAAKADKTNGFAIAGFVLGICSVVFGWICCFNITTILGLVFSIIGVCQTAKENKSGKGLAIAGIVLCAIALLGWILVGAVAEGIRNSVTRDFDSFYRIYDDILSQI